MKWMYALSIILLYMFIWHVCVSLDIKIAAILPEDDSRLFSTKRVSPAIEYAIEALQRDTDYLRGHTVQVFYRDSNCTGAAGINHAINYYMERKVDVFFGPVCDFSVAPVARQVLYWNIPLLSTGAMADDFTKYRHTEYQLLSRVGPVNFVKLASAMIRIFYRFSLYKVKIIYDREGQADIMDGFCHLAASGIHHKLRSTNITQDYFKLSTDDIAMLKNEVGLSYGEHLKMTPICTCFVLLVTLVLHCTCREINIAALLPEDDRRLFSVRHVSPAIEFAVQHLQHNTDYLRGHVLTVSYRDSNCSSADGINHAINFYTEKKVDVFFGPVCDFAVAPVARQVRFWNIPLLSPGAMAGDFTTHHHTEYQLLSRVGPMNFDNLSSALIKIFYYYEMNNVKLIYDKDGQSEVMDGFCHLATSALHYNMLATAINISQDYYKINSPFSDEALTLMLKMEVGLTFPDLI